MIVCVLLGWFGKDVLRQALPPNITSYTALFACCIPTLQYLLFSKSSILGVPYGAVITESLTYYPLVLLSIYTAATLVETVDFSAYGDFFAAYGPRVGTYALFSFFEGLSQGFIRANIGSIFLLTRFGLQLVLGALYALLLPSVLTWIALPSILFSLTFNVHVPLSRPTAVLNSTLQSHSFTLLDRAESVTGYISVLENTREHYRVMRADHSLLGGDWRLPSTSITPNHPVRSPIYSIFTTLEAIRLINPDDPNLPGIPDSTAHALNIGLGIGTAPSALIAHGIHTTILELDPVVARFATAYFDFPTPDTSNLTKTIITDAVDYITSASQTSSSQTTPKYDYVIHDVFTGGAEPVDLFTLEFFQSVSKIMTTQGVIAINYAGDLSTPSAGLVIRTIKTVWASCRIFREDEAPPPPQAHSENGKPTEKGDFTNMVIFCKQKSQNNSPLTFRDPIPADFLGSGARQKHLMPRWEIEDTFGDGDVDGKNILKRGQTAQLERLQTKSAVEHWEIMRGVMPREVWENW